jgi:CHASE2 domain-containing sensor protein
VTGPAASKKGVVASIVGAVLAVLCGFILWATPLGDLWVNASYDNLFRFGSPAVTNQVTLIQMDNAAFAQFHQQRDRPWDRGLHARLLNRLAKDGCALVVIDSFFSLRDPAVDDELAAAMSRQRNVVLMAKQSQLSHPEFAGVQPILPADLFLQAAKTNWGVAWLDPDLDSVVRRHWPFPSPGPYPSLPWTVARLAGAVLSDEPQERWLRYYGESGNWENLSYGYALAKPQNYFRNRTVFVGTEPETTLPNGDPDKFRTPYTDWTGEASGGVEILVTEFLNLLNHDSLVRPPAWLEILVLTLAGVLVGGGLCRWGWRTAVLVAAGLFVGVFLAAICLSIYTNYWFPWLIIAGGQIPCGLGCAVVADRRRARDSASPSTLEPAPKTPGYQLIYPHFAEGSYGKVWLARQTAGPWWTCCSPKYWRNRNSARQWRALKVIYQSRFGQDLAPYEREFAGVQKYHAVSHRHPGLLQVDFVSQKEAGCFYYVMELGDALAPGWERSPRDYKPRDLVTVRAPLHRRRLPVRECVGIGLKLCEALEFLHQQGITHRDIKPENVIFVNGQPKLADLGLVTGIRPADREGTLVGTMGYMPPLPESPGTVAADIYALGMVLYVISTGRQPMQFPEMATTLVSAAEPPDFLPLNRVIMKACQPVASDRHASAAQLAEALMEALKQMQEGDQPGA